MNKGIHKLTDKEARNATTEGARQRKLADGGGLTLVVRPTSKAWWLRYRFHGKSFH